MLMYGCLSILAEEEIQNTSASVTCFQETKLQRKNPQNIVIALFCPV